MGDQVNSDWIGTRCMIAWAVFLVPYIYLIWVALHWFSCRTHQWQQELDRAHQPHVGKRGIYLLARTSSHKLRSIRNGHYFARSTLTRCHHSLHFRHMRLVCFLFLWSFAVAVRPNNRPIGASRIPSALLRHGESTSKDAFNRAGNRPPAQRLELIRNWTHSRRVKRTRILAGRRRAWNLLNRYNLTRDPRKGVLLFDEPVRNWTHSRRVKRTRILAGRRRAWNLLNRYNLTTNPRKGVLLFDEPAIILPSELSCRHPYLADPHNTRCVCGAQKWPEESLNCCDNGRYCVPRLQSIPPAIASLCRQADFCAHQRANNTIFAFTALGASPAPQGPWTQPPGQSMLQLHARTYHRLCDLFGTYHERVAINNLARFYIIDGERMATAHEQHLNPSIVQTLQECLHSCNRWVQRYRSIMLDVLQNPDSQGSDACVTFESQENQHHIPEIGAVTYQASSTSLRNHVYAYAQGQSTDRPRFVPLWSPCYETLQYPLLFFRGEAGWTSGDPFNHHVGRTISCTTVVPVPLPFYCRQRFLAEPQFHRLGRVTQEFALDALSRWEEFDLQYFESPALQQRIARYRDIMSASAGRVGKVLPTSFRGHPMQRNRAQDDAMSIVTRRGKPHRFITMTCNNEWPEITQNILPHQTAFDRPDLCVRAFTFRLSALMHDLRHEHIFGDLDYEMYTIEYQRRGSPHAHIVVKFKGPGPEVLHEVDRWVWARIPSQELYGELFAKVQKFMIHRRCGAFSQTQPCMKENVTIGIRTCSKGFPQPFRDVTTVNERTGRAEYCRPRDGRTIPIRQKVGNSWQTVEADNQWVVPYNPWLLMKYSCHIMVDIASAGAVVKYLYKYCLKHPDFVRARIAHQNNEIEAYRSVRYVSSSEAVWRLCGFLEHERHPAVHVLCVHHENDHQVVINHDDPIQAQQAAAANTITDLMSYFKRPSACQRLNYLEYFEQYTIAGVPGGSRRRRNWIKDGYGRWVHRKNESAQCVARLHYLTPLQGDIWYLRLLLHPKPGRSWQDLRTVDGNGHVSYEAAARALGLIARNDEFSQCMHEASTFRTGHELRRLFVTLILNGAPALRLWTEFITDLTEDFQAVPQHVARIRALEHIDEMLQAHGKTTSSLGLPTIHHRLSEYERRRQAIDVTKEQTYINETYPWLTHEQRTIYDEVLRSATGSTPGCFLLDAAAATGKTYTLNALSAGLLSLGHVCVCVATTGIAACELPDGRTAHSMFRLPLKERLVEGCVCDISVRDDRAELLRKCTLVMWDEIPSTHRFCVEALDRTLRDLTCVNRPFGGKTILLCGDWRQTGPIVPFGADADVVQASLISSPLWGKLQRRHLTLPQRDQGDTAHAQFVRQVGENRVPTSIVHGIKTIGLTQTAANPDGNC